ncbi:MAG: putative glutamine ABC transporter permease protein GlnM [Alphaproteobacteria bacterium MarineAlpha3_Bin5]|nr:MAG: putative glutamine ABC transporter permease protein GlnM [Alphaproteobacteria bacterium MarineAlpha3_Bin5]
MEVIIDFFGFNFIQSQLPRFWNGFQLTLAIALVSMLGAVVWGIVLVGPRMSNSSMVAGPVIGYVELVRNTPLLLQIYLSYFGLPLIGLPLSAFLCGVIAIASQHGAFLCEIYRAGIEAVSKKQWEGALALGMTRKKAKYRVILPQAFVNVVPPIGNQLVILIKDTSLVSAIGIIELTLSGKMVIERSGASFEVFLFIAAVYLFLTSSFGAGLRLLENRLRARQ